MGGRQVSFFGVRIPSDALRTSAEIGPVIIVFRVTGSDAGIEFPSVQGASRGIFHCLERVVRGNILALLQTNSVPSVPLLRPLLAGRTGNLQGRSSGRHHGSGELCCRSRQLFGLRWRVSCLILDSGIDASLSPHRVNGTDAKPKSNNRYRGQRLHSQLPHPLLLVHALTEP